MTDTIPTTVRSRMMAAVKGKDTNPEMTVRKGLHALGFRYALHSRRLPGKPDLVLPKYRAAVFIHGCFWHGHGCPACRPAKSRKEFWEPKIAGNKERDERTLTKLHVAGWRTLVIWECSLGRESVESTIAKAADWLRGTDADTEIEGYSSGSSAPSSTSSSGAASGTALPAK